MMEQRRRRRPGAGRHEARLECASRMGRAWTRSKEGRVLLARHLGAVDAVVPAVGEIHPDELRSSPARALPRLGRRAVTRDHGFDSAIERRACRPYIDETGAGVEIVDERSGYIAIAEQIDATAERDDEHGRGSHGKPPRRAV